jgi:thiamine-phosphate pyrophosphorylase
VTRAGELRVYAVLDAALAAGAAGVHLGRSDTVPTDARRLLGDGAIVDATVHHADEADALDLHLVGCAVPAVGVERARSKRQSP